MGTEPSLLISSQKSTAGKSIFLPDLALWFLTFANVRLSVQQPWLLHGSVVGGTKHPGDRGCSECFWWKVKGGHSCYWALLIICMPPPPPGVKWKIGCIIVGCYQHSLNQLCFSIVFLPSHLPSNCGLFKWERDGMLKVRISIKDCLPHLQPPEIFCFVSFFCPKASFSYSNFWRWFNFSALESPL